MYFQLIFDYIYNSIPLKIYITRKLNGCFTKQQINYPLDCVLKIYLVEFSSIKNSANTQWLTFCYI